MASAITNSVWYCLIFGKYLWEFYFCNCRGDHRSSVLWQICVLRATTDRPYIIPLLYQKHKIINSAVFGNIVMRMIVKGKLNNKQCLLLLDLLINNLWEFYFCNCRGDHRSSVLWQIYVLRATNGRPYVIPLFGKIRKDNLICRFDNIVWEWALKASAMTNIVCYCSICW